MQDLDEKLKALANTKEHEYQCIGYSEGQLCCLEKPEIVERIKQVFVEAGWQVPGGGLRGNTMTGQEFFDRFCKETAGELFPYRTDAEQKLVVKVARFFVDSARKAAGLES